MPPQRHAAGSGPSAASSSATRLARAIASGRLTATRGEPAEGRLARQRAPSPCTSSRGSRPVSRSGHAFPDHDLLAQRKSEHCRRLPRPSRPPTRRSQRAQQRQGAGRARSSASGSNSASRRAGSSSARSERTSACIRAMSASPAATARCARLDRGARCAAAGSPRPRSPRADTGSRRGPGGCWR